MKTALFFSDAMGLALGWTLVHSLWQAALVGLVLTVILPRLQGARQRYLAAYSALLTVFTAALVTCSYYYFSWQDAAPKVLFFNDAAITARITIENSPSGSTWGWLDWLESWLDAWNSTLVSIWLTGFVLLLLRMSGGLWYLRHLRAKAHPLPEVFAGITQNTYSKYPVRLLQSLIVHTPVAFGWLKPVILLPAGLVNHLTIAEVEAVVMHEMGHILRRDWIMNLIQTLVEAVFYYHPVIWWISSVVRQERENCCDEWAIAQIGNDRLTYARALLRVQEYAKLQAAIPAPALALGAEGPRARWFRRRAHLLERIQIILLQSPQQKSMIMERMLITGLLMVTLTFWGLQAAPPLPELLEDAHLFWGFDALDQNPVATKDTLPPSSQKGQSIHRISTDDGQQKVELEVKNGDITRLAIDGREIPPAEYDQYEDLTEKLLKTPPPAPPAPPAPLSPLSPMAPPAPPAPWGMSPGAAVAPFIFNGGGKVYIDKNGKDGTVIQLNNGGKPTEIVVKDGVVTIDGEPVQEGDSHQIHGQHFFNWEDQSRQPFIFQHGDGRHFEFRSDGNGIAVFPEGNFEFDFEMPEIDINMEHLNESMEHLQERMEELRHQMPEVPEFHFETPHPDIHVPIPPIPPVAKGLHPHSFQQALLNELRRDHLVTDPDNYSVELSAKKLKVNGKRQPANMHQKYLALYKRHTGRELSGDDVFKVSYKL